MSDNTLTIEEIAGIPGDVIVDLICIKSLHRFIKEMWDEVESCEFKDGWHIAAICKHLEAVTKRDILRLVISEPPRFMKSLTVSVFWPAWVWLQKPGERFLASSYAETLSIRDSVKCRSLTKSDRYRKILNVASQIKQKGWGRKRGLWDLVQDENMKRRFTNTFGGSRICTSVGGTLTGEGGDIVIVDDAHNIIDGESEVQRQSVLEWWDQSMSTRLNDTEGAYVVVGQRVHEHDFMGHLLDENEHLEGKRKWVHLCLPYWYEGENRVDSPLGFEDPRKVTGELLWPSKWGEEDLADRRLRLGTYGTASQLQQRPAPREGGILQSSWFVVVKSGIEKVDRRVRFWDLAATKQKMNLDPDYTCGGLLCVKNGIYWIEDIRRMRGTPMNVEHFIRNTAEEDPEGTQIWMEQEPGASGVMVIDHYRRKVLQGYSFRGIKSTGSKETYVDPFAAAAQAGNVNVVSAEWNSSFFDECNMFPAGRHDDQVDSVSKGFGRLKISKRIGVIGRPRTELRYG